MQQRKNAPVGMGQGAQWAEPTSCHDMELPLCPDPAAGITPGAASQTALSASHYLGTASDWVYCAFRDDSMTPHTMSVYKLNVKDWLKVSRGASFAHLLVAGWALPRGGRVVLVLRLLHGAGKAICCAGASGPYALVSASADRRAPAPHRAPCDAVVPADASIVPRGLRAPGLLAGLLPAL